MRSVPAIERIHRPSVEDFRKEYLVRSHPVVITGLTDDWPEKSLLSRESLRRDHGDLVASVRGTDDEFEFFFSKGADTVKSLSLREYIDAIEVWSPSGPRPPYWGNISLTRPPTPEMATAFGGRFTFPPYFPETTHETRLWVAAEGQRSTIHNDPYGNLNAQIWGRKSFLLFHPRSHFDIYAERIHPALWASPVDPQKPEFQKYPRFRDAEAIEVVLEEGETLFIPIFWWHQARAITLSVNVNNWFEAVGGFWSPLRAQRLR